MMEHRCLRMPLRFGVVPLEFGPATERVIVDGVPDFSRFDVVEIVRDAVEEGYRLIEVSMDLEHILPGSLTPESITKLAELKDELGHSYTAHLPFWSVELATFNQTVRRGSVDCIVNSIKLVEPLEPESYVLHSTGALAMEFSKLGYSPMIMKVINNYLAGYSAESIEEILSRTEVDPKKIAVENIEFPFEYTREVIDAYDLGICFDTGHLLCRFSGTESLVEFYRTHKDRIIELHLQDGFYKNVEGVAVTDDHMALGCGEMDVKAILTELVKDNFSGPIIFELSREEAKESMSKIREEVPEALG
jgi:sugar phosphate isomerase/epimerase